QLHTIDRLKRPICDRHFQHPSSIPREPLAQRGPADTELLGDVAERSSFGESFEDRAHVRWSALNGLLACPRLNRRLPGAAFASGLLTIPIGDTIIIWNRRLAVVVTSERTDASPRAGESLLRSDFDLTRGSLMPAPPCAASPKLDRGVERSGEGCLVRILEALRQKVLRCVLDHVLCFVQLEPLLARTLHKRRAKRLIMLAILFRSHQQLLS